MMKETKQKLTLDRPTTYQIKVPGHLDEDWSDWAGTVDQAALQGLLRRLYSLGLPLLSVNRVDTEE